MSSTAPGGVTIGDLAEQTGLSVATLRAWESRYGFPTPGRSPTGHRRYSQDDAGQVRRVIELRAAGMSLAAAIARARDSGAPAGAVRSVYAALRLAHPQLTPQVLSRKAMLAISTAIEDESCAAGAQPLLIGFFQRERFYRARQARWRELARTAWSALVFADFPAAAAPTGGPVEIALPPTTPLRREWALICQAGDATACLAGWELPAGSVPQAGRRFEAVWSLSPAVTATAAGAAIRYAALVAPDLVPADAATAVPPTDADVLARASSLTARIVAYLDS